MNTRGGKVRLDRIETLPEMKLRVLSRYVDPETEVAEVRDE
jgi:hypothetical protein